MFTTLISDPNHRLLESLISWGKRWWSHLVLAKVIKIQVTMFENEWEVTWNPTCPKMENVWWLPESCNKRTWIVHLNIKWRSPCIYIYMVKMILSLIIICISTKNMTSWSKFALYYAPYPRVVRKIWKRFSCGHGFAH